MGKEGPRGASGLPKGKAKVAVPTLKEVRGDVPSLERLKVVKG